MKTLLSALGDKLAARFKQDDEHGCGCCEIPETTCPPRCVGQIEWKIARGALPKGAIVVRNVGQVAREFRFSATALAGLSPAAASVRVQPAFTHLAPGDSQVVQVELQGSSGLHACQEYRAEILIRGAWEQCVRVRVDVTRDPFDSLHVEQGDALADKALHAGHVKASIDWKLERGVTPEAAVTVHNVGSAMCTLSFDATPLVGVDAPGAHLKVTPDSMQLPAGHTGVLRVALQGSSALAPGHGYRAEVLVHGFYRQQIALHAFVLPDPFAHVEVEQGEAPTRRRAHQWYDHFQCTERCAPPLS